MFVKFFDKRVLRSLNPNRCIELQEEIIEFRFFNGPYDVMADMELLQLIRNFASRSKYSKSVVLGGKIENHSLILVPVMEIPLPTELRDSEYANEIESTLRILSKRGDWKDRTKPVVLIDHEVNADRVLRLLRDYTDPDLLIDVGVIWMVEKIAYTRYSPISIEPEMSKRGTIKGRNEAQNTPGNYT